MNFHHVHVAIATASLLAVGFGAGWLAHKEKPTPLQITGTINGQIYICAEGGVIWPAKAYGDCLESDRDKKLANDRRGAPTPIPPTEPQQTYLWDGKL